MFYEAGALQEGESGGWRGNDSPLAAHFPGSIAMIIGGERIYLPSVAARRSRPIRLGLPIAVTVIIHLEKQSVPKKLVYRPLYTETELPRASSRLSVSISTL